MARHHKSTHTTSQPNDSPHATYAALTARLTAFQSQLSAQAKSRTAHEAPSPTLDMAADLIAQMSRLMHRAPEARGLPRFPNDRAVTFSELSVAFAQTQHAFDAFGKRMGFDKPVPKPPTNEFRNEIVRMINVRIIVGIREGYLVPTGGEYDSEKRELSQQFRDLVDRLDLIVDAEALPDPNEKWF